MCEGKNGIRGERSEFINYVYNSCVKERGRRCQERGSAKYQLINEMLIFIYCRRRSVQYHYASSECRFIKCPRDEETIREQTIMQPSSQDKPHYFNCDPSCQEVKYFHYRKAEVLVSGQEHGEGFI